MAANECWISVEVKRNENASTTTIIAVKREESCGSLLGRVYSQNSAETVEKTTIDLVVKYDIHSLFINISLPTDPIFESTILLKQHC